MKKFICSIVIALIAASSFAEYVAIPFKLSGVSATATQSAYTNNMLAYGKVVGIDALSETSMNVRVTTVNGIGSSISGAKTILSDTSITSAGYASNLSSTVYLWGDKIVIIGTNAAVTNKSISGMVILER